MLFVFSANMHTFFYDNKGVFIDVFQSAAEMNTFIFGKDRNDHISCFFGITTTRLPPGCIPVKNPAKIGESVNIRWRITKRLAAMF